MGWGVHMMFRITYVFLAGLVAVCAGPVRANATDAGTLQKAGMVGSWAMDCSSPYGPNNAWMSYAVRGSKAVRILNYQKDLDGTFDLSNIRLIGANRISLVDRNSKGTTYEVVYEKTANRLQSVSSKRNDGVILIKDGNFVSSGKPTPVFEKCGKS